MARRPFPASNVARRLIFIALIAAAGLHDVSAEENPPANRWENAIQAFEEADRQSPPPRDAILFVGSSSIRRWDLSSSFPDLPVINRGFGGSHISDCVAYAPRIVIPSRPRTIVLYAGDNDVAGGKSPQTVCDDFKAFVKTVHEALPAARIVLLAIKPSPRRWSLFDTMARANAMMERVTKRDDRLIYVDIAEPMLGDDGKPRAELFAADKLHLSPAGYELWASLVRPHLDAPMPRRHGTLRVATCQFPVSADVAANGKWIRNQMRDARAQNAQVAHFPECALSGYAGVDHDSLDDFDWARQRIELDAIRTLAGELNLWVILGATHRLSGSNRPHNSLYVIDPAGEIVDRYDKRFCTTGDLRYYSPGDHFVTVEINGVRCGLLICYDIRFPELYRRYHELGVQMVFHSFYNARHKEDCIHPKIMPPTAQARAGTNYMFLSVSNSSARHSWESLFVTPDGLIHERLGRNEAGVMVNLVDTTSRFYDASRPYRLDSIRGKLNSGQVVDDPRSRNRQDP